MFSLNVVYVLVLIVFVAVQCWDLGILLHDAEFGAYQEHSGISLQQSARYTAGYIRTDFTEVVPEGKFFVQSEVLTIGVCYSSAILVTPDAPTLEPTASPTFNSRFTANSAVYTESNRAQIGHLRAITTQQQELGSYQKLVAVRLDTSKNAFSLFYQDFTDPACTAQVNAFTVLQKFQSSALLNNKLLKTDSRYVETRALATSVPSFNNGYILSYYGSLAACTGEPFKFLVGTDRCANYLGFYGRVECGSEGLISYSYPQVGVCTGFGTQFSQQPLLCTNVGTVLVPSYQSVECVGNI